MSNETNTGIMLKAIPSTGEMLPVVGCGTWQTFDIGASEADLQLPQNVFGALFDGGGTLIDSSPMYGRAEAVVGNVLSKRFERSQAFIATKVWTTGRAAGIAQMQRSFELLKTDTIDLMQIHNLVDWRVHLPILRDWKAAGRIRYIGITHYTAGAHKDLEAVLRAEPFDFVQLNYALDDRAAESRLLPAAQDLGVAVLVNRPFGEGSLIRRLKGRPLPPVAAELGCSSWAQLALKYVVSHPGVTCAIPATSSAEHMRDNISAGSGNTATPDQRRAIVAAFQP